MLGGASVTLDLLPDGVKSILAWLGDLIQRLDRIPWDGDTPVQQRSFILILDEVEVHLHPEAQRQIVPMLSELFPNAQVFIATHSPFVIASAEDAWIHQFYFDGDQVKVKPPVPSQYGRSYAAVLRDIMGVDARFAPEVEGELQQLRDLRDAAYRADPAAIESFRALAERMSERSAELATLVGAERARLEAFLHRANP